MMYIDHCQICGHPEEDLRSHTMKHEPPRETDGSIRPCPVCHSTNWKVQEIYLPQRCWGLKGEMENFPLKSHLKDNRGNRMVFNDMKSYQRELDRRGMRIMGNEKVSAPAPSSAKPTKELEQNPLFKKMKEAESKAPKVSPKYLSQEEMDNEFAS